MIENAVINNLKDLIKVTMLAHRLHNWDDAATLKWMEEPNEILFNSSPTEVCLRGDADTLIKWLKDKL